MLTEDKLEPVAREIAHFLTHNGVTPGSSWQGYDRSEDLLPLQRREDDLVEFIRASNNQARLRLLRIRELMPDPDSIRFHPAIVLRSEPKAEASITIDNLQGERESQPHVFHKVFHTGTSEADAIEAGWQLETWATASASASGGIGVAEAEVSAETGWRSTLSAAWSRQTGKTRDEETGGSFPFVAGPHSLVEAYLQWEEQTKQRRIECDASYDFAIEIGRRSKPKRRGWRWNTGSPLYWDSLEHLIAVAEQRGRVGHALYQHFSTRVVDRDGIARIQAERLRHIDRLTPEFSGADALKVVIANLETIEGDDDE